jgi:hypothetical protein
LVLVFSRKTNEKRGSSSRAFGATCRLILNPGWWGETVRQGMT